MKISIIALAASAFILAGCDRAPANLQTLQTTDCGVTWNVIKIGQRIPTTAGNVCGYNTTIPDYPMQGETEFKAQFDGNVLVTVKISYDYEIIDGVKYIAEAKYLGKAGGTAAEAAKAGTGPYETAENQVIDVRIREAATSRTVKQKIVEFNSAKFEDELLAAANTDLAVRGVRLNSMTFVMVPEEQTRMAIDAATAINVYKSNGMSDFGEKLAVAKAGAPHITINMPAQGK